MADSESIPVGYRFSTVTPQDHGGLVYIAAFLSFTYTNLTFLSRCFIKWKVFGVDDYATCITQVIFTVQFALLLVSLSAGLGKNFAFLDGAEFSRMAATQYGNQVTVYIAIGLSKCAAMLLVQRLFTRDAKKFWIICSIGTGFMVAWTAFAAFMVSVGCSPASIAPAAKAQICTGIFTRYKVVVVTDALTDVILVIVPTYLVWQLQMSAKLKLQVIAVFAFRLPLVVFAALALKAFNKSLHSTNPGVDRALVIVYQQCQLCFSLLAATVPCLKSFIRSFDTGSGVKVQYTSNGYDSNGYRRGESYRMESMSGNGSALRSRNEDKGDIKVTSRPFPKEGHGHGHGHGRSRATSASKVSTIAYSVDRPKEEDTASHGSQELIIRRDVHWEVHSENLR